jgi:hypothetical protein
LRPKAKLREGVAVMILPQADPNGIDNFRTKPLKQMQEKRTV